MRKHIKNHGQNHAQSSLGVRTRAKTMALKRSSLFMSTSTIIEDITTKKGGNECYLQLRSRRLERFIAPLTKKAKRQKYSPKKKGVDIQKRRVGIKFEKKLPKDEEKIASDHKIDQGNNGIEDKQEKLDEKEKNKKDEKDDYDEIEPGSVGDNELNFENKERNTRESTPSSLVVGSNIMKTPTSSSSKTTTKKKILRLIPGMPSAQELEEFFAKEEKKQIEKFIREYNFDPVNEKPLKGRYEWVKTEP